MRRSLDPKERGFTHTDCRHLSEALGPSIQGRLYRRIQAVLLIAKGRRFSEVARITGLSLRSVYHLVARYLEHHQVESLCDLPRTGRPQDAPGLELSDILRELPRSPLELGYRTNVWTVRTLADHLNHTYQWDIGPWALRQRMKQMNLVFKRPRYIFSEKDPHRAQKKGGNCSEIEANARWSGAAL